MNHFSAISNQQSAFNHGMDIPAFLIDLETRVKAWATAFDASVTLAEEAVHAMELLDGTGRSVNVVLWFDGDDATGPDAPESTLHAGKIWLGITRHAGLSKNHFANMVEDDPHRAALLRIVQDLRRFLLGQTFANGLQECAAGAWLHSDGMSPLAIAPGQFLRGYALRMKINYTALVDAPVEGAHGGAMDDGPPPEFGAAPA